MAIDWSSPHVLAICGIIFNNFSHASIGAYLWYWIRSLRVELDYIKGRRKFRPSVLLYCWCKWSPVAAFTGMLVSFNNTAPLNCQALFAYIQFSGITSVGAATSLLMLRTVALWPRKWIVLVPLGLISAGQWGIIFQGITAVKASYNPAIQSCEVEGVHGIFLDLVYLYTMFVDFVVLILTYVGLWRTPAQSSSLWRLVFAQGIAYFLIACIANMFPAIIILLDLNPIMNVMFGIPAVAVTAIAACECFISLQSIQNPTDNATTNVAPTPRANFKKPTVHWTRTEDIAKTRSFITRDTSIRFDMGESFNNLPHLETTNEDSWKGKKDPLAL